MALNNEIEGLARPIADAHGAYIIDTEIRGERGGRIVEVFIDTDTGVTTELCAEISRGISQLLDQGNLIRGRYHLVVSSPGISRPLKFPRQYPKHVGRMLTVTLRTGDGQQTIDGTLESADDAGITLRLKDGTSLAFPFDAVRQAVVIPAW